MSNEITKKQMLERFNILTETCRNTFDTGLHCFDCSLRGECQAIRSLIEASGGKAEGGEKPCSCYVWPGPSDEKPKQYWPCPTCSATWEQRWLETSPGSSSIEGYPASVKQALTVPAPLPEVEEAIKCMEQNAPWGYPDDSIKERIEHDDHMCALAVIKAALSRGVEWEKRYAELVETVAQRAGQMKGKV
jgi:hypothetical protein